MGLQLSLEEFKYRLRPNDGGKDVPDGGQGIGEASIDDGWSMDRFGENELRRMNEGGQGFGSGG